MTDQPEKKSETEDVEADFEGHRQKGGGAPSDAKSATDDDSADFEGHRMVSGPEKLYKKV